MPGRMGRTHIASFRCRPLWLRATDQNWVFRGAVALRDAMLRPDEVGRHAPYPVGRKLTPVRLFACAASRFPNSRPQ